MTEHLAGRDLKRSYEWLGYAAGLPAKPVPFTSQSGNQVLAAGRHILMGVSFRNLSTFGGAITLNDGLDANSIPLVTVGFGGSATVLQPIAANGIMCEIGVFLNSLSGCVLTGSAWIVPLWNYPSTPPGE